MPNLRTTFTRPWQLALIVALALASPNAPRLLQTLAEPPLQIDFAAYYLAAARMLAGDPTIYSAWPGGQAASLPAGFNPPPFLYPPPAALLFVPLSRLPFGSAQPVWLLANVLATALACLLLATHLRLPGRTTALLAVLIGLYSPFQRTIALGQVAAVLLLLLAGSYLLHERRRDWAAGALLGAAALLKVFPAVFVVYFALRGRWALVGGALAAAATIVSVSIALFGLPVHLEYVLGFLPALFARPVVDDPLANASIPAVAGWVLGGAPAARAIAAIGSALVLGLTVLALRRPPAGPFERGLDYAVVLAATLLTIGSSYDHQLLLLALPLLLLALGPGAPTWSRDRRVLAAAVVYACIVSARYWRVAPWPEPVALLALTGSLCRWAALLRERLAGRRRPV